MPWFRSGSWLAEVYIAPILCLGLLLLLPNSAAAQLQSTTSAPVGKLYGHVINAATGLPVARALVRFNDRAILTDHDGNYLLDQITDTGGSLQVTRPGFTMSPDPAEGGGQFLQLNQVSLPLDIRIYPEALITGTVTGPDGEPLQHIGVTARRSTFDESGHHWQNTGNSQTDSHGQFRMTITAGDYKIQTRYMQPGIGRPEAVLPIVVPAPGVPTAPQTIHLKSGEEQHFDLQATLRRTYPVEATIDSQGRGFPTLTARTSDGATLNLAQVANRTPGVMRFDLPAGSYTIDATINSPDGIETAEANITVAGQAISGLVLHFTPVPAIPVEVVLDPSATSNSAQSTTITPPNPQQLGLLLQRVDSAADSEFGFNGAQLQSRRDSSPAFNAVPGTYRLTSRAFSQWYIRSATFGATDLLSQNLVVAPGTGGVPIRLVVTNQTGTLQGTLSLAGKPAACWVYLINTAPTATPIITVRSNKDGTFTNSLLPPGTYRAIAFEHRRSVDFTNPDSLAPYSAQIQSVTVVAGNKSSLTLDAVPQTEVTP